MYIAGRSESKAGPAIDELKAATGKEAMFLQLDLADLASIRRCAREYMTYVSNTFAVFTQCSLTESILSGKSRSYMYSSTTRKYESMLPFHIS